MKAIAKSKQDRNITVTVPINQDLRIFIDSRRLTKDERDSTTIFIVCCEKGRRSVN